MIWVNTYTIHRRADFFPDPDAFIPERFLEQEIPKDAWRPFEKGPRSCIGQELGAAGDENYLGAHGQGF
jgi:cytochrome P450